MKNKYLLLNIVILVLGVILLLPTKNNDGVRKYHPRESEIEQYSAKGAAKYLNRIRANQETKRIDIKDVNAAQKGFRAMPQRKSGTDTWEFRGPDNIGGRTRALLIDKDNSSIMYAGSVSGGLWKSTSAGQFWKQIKYEGLNGEVENMNISCITQASNGDLYFGTGEGFYFRNASGVGGFIGDGIWKSTDNGETFKKLESTNPTTADDAFAWVYEVAADPTNENVIYAGTEGGLKVSTDAGNTWTNVTLDQGINVVGGEDVSVNADGLVVASISKKCYVKKPGESVFKLRSGKDSSQGGNLISNTNVARLEFAFAPTDPNYIYCSAISASPYGSLRNIYQSKDGGDNWVIIGKGGSDYFNPFRDQGVFDNVIAVNASNKDIIYVGGIDLYEGKAVATGDLFDWTQLSYWFLDYWRENYIHADMHAICFDLKNPKTFFIASDGGISRGFIDYENTPYLFKVMNNSYGVTQNYSVAANSQGHLLTGTQDNGSLVIDGQGNTHRSAREVHGGDGGHVAISDIRPTSSFVTQYYGGLYRNNDANYGDWNDFYTTNMIDLHWSADKGYTGLASGEGYFITPIAYWETDNDELGVDTVAFIARRDYEVDEYIVFSSENIFGAPIPITIEINEDHPEYGDTIGYKKSDTILFHDPYGSLFALGMARTVWLTREAASFVNPTNKDWFRAIKLGVFEGSFAPTNDPKEKTTQLVFSEDGDNLFIATNYGSVYRLGNLKHARDKATGCTEIDPDDVVTTLAKIGGFGNRAITGLAVDPNNGDNLIVTLGNYGNTGYVYLCTDATTAIANTGYGNFINMTHNLPVAPAYAALVEQTPNKGRVLIGTELGVFITEDVFTQASITLTWEPFNEGLDPIAVYQIDQTLTSKWTAKNGMIYIGTHAQGFFENSAFYVPNTIEASDPVVKVDGSKVQMSVYPNPVADMANVNYVLPKDAAVKMYLYSISGQLLMTIDGGYKVADTENSIQIQMNALPKGTYLLNVVAGQAQSTERIIKR